MWTTCNDPPKRTLPSLRMFLSCFWYCAVSLGRPSESNEIQTKATLYTETADTYWLLHKSLTQTPSESQYLVGSIKISRAVGQGDFPQVGLISLRVNLPIKPGQRESSFQQPLILPWLTAKQHSSVFCSARDDNPPAWGRCLSNKSKVPINP